jgi:hypothetical protein
VDCWTVLGLEPTADERAVLRAYARKLRETRPEDDPEGFQRLLAAREQALAWRERIPPPPPPPPLGGEEGDPFEPPARAADQGRRPFRVVMGAEMSAPPKDGEHTGGSSEPNWRAHRPTPVLPPPEPRAPPVDDDWGWRSPRVEFEPAPPGASAPDEVAALRARWLALSREDDEVFWRLEAWEEILRRTGALAILERETVRRELAALFAGRLPPLADSKGYPRPEILAVLARLAEEFDLTRPTAGSKRLPAPNLAVLADWLNAVAATREVARRRALGKAAYRSESGIPLIPQEDRAVVLGTKELIDDYDHLWRLHRRRWRPIGRIAWRAALVASSVCANLDAPRLAVVVLALDLATFVLAGAALRALESDGPFSNHPWRLGVEAGLPVAAFLAARLAAILLWPRFSIQAAVRRVRRADLAGLALPAARKAILSRRFGDRWWTRPLAIFGGLMDLLALAAVIAVIGGVFGTPS